MLRLSLAIIAGFMLWSLLWLGNNTLMQTLFPTAIRPNSSVDDSRLLVLLLFMAALISIGSGYVTLWIAQATSIRAALILGIVLLVVGIIVQRQYWELLPLWYHLIFLTLLLPATLLGGWLRLRG